MRFVSALLLAALMAASLSPASAQESAQIVQDAPACSKDHNTAACVRVYAYMTVANAQYRALISASNGNAVLDRAMRQVVGDITQDYSGRRYTPREAYFAIMLGQFLAATTISQNALLENHMSLAHEYLPRAIRAGQAILADPLDESYIRQQKAAVKSLVADDERMLRTI